MRITFVLPVVPRVPMGGVKVVQAHAVGLAARGHRVTVVGPHRGGRGLGHRLRAAAVRLRDRWHGVAQAEWEVGPGVDAVEVDVVGPGVIPDADAVIATGWQTAPWVAALPPSKGVGMYFLQHVETFMDPAAAGTWRLPLVQFAVSAWIRDRVNEAGGHVSALVPNAIDPLDFALDRPIAGRQPSLAWLYHRAPVKGPELGIEVLNLVRERWPDLRAEVFSARPPSHRLPSWVAQHVRPPISALRALYNRSAVVLHTAVEEGWGLTPMEGAACGCAVAAFGNGGLREYLVPGETASLVPVGDVEALAEAVHVLLADPTERIRQAEAGRRAVQEYSWERSTARMESVIAASLINSGLER